MFRAYSDGFCKPNPGTMGIGGVILEGDRTLVEICENHGPGTNNLAEYLALIAMMKKSLELGINKISAFSDSELLVNQVNMKYKVRNDSETMAAGNRYEREVREIQSRLDSQRGKSEG